MALDQSALLELLDVMRSADGGDLMRRLLATSLQLLVDAEATSFIGAEPHQRTDARTNLRNGTREAGAHRMSDSGEVGVDYGVPLFVGEVHRMPIRGDAGVRDHDVETTERPERLGDDRAHARGIANVGLDGMRASAESLTDRTACSRSSAVEV